MYQKVCNTYFPHWTKCRDYSQPKLTENAANEESKKVNALKKNQSYEWILKYFSGMSDLIKMWNYVPQIEYTNKLIRITLDIHCSKLRYIYCWLLS